METLRAERVSLLLLRGLAGAIRAYYKLVDESTEEQIPASRVLRIEQLEPLSLAVQMYCLYLRALECDKAGINRIMEVAWRSLELTPEVRDDVVAQAKVLYEQMRAYPIFRATATVFEMVAERCEAIIPTMKQAPELRAHVEQVSGCFNTLQQIQIA